jgi:iron complex outermembrane receptor protein
MDDGSYVFRLGLVAALGSLCIAGPTFADDAAGGADETAPPPAAAQTSSAPELSEIIVTARRVEERLQDVPISITVFNQEQLTNRNVVNASDLALYTPSLSANTNFGQENTSFAIRGFVQDAGTPPSVGVYFADVVALRGPTQGTQAGDGAGPGSFFDLQNVQVLKGPQGTLFGRNTTGGAVLFVPQKPTSNFEGYVEASAGDYDMQRVQAAVNLPVSDSLRVRVALDHNQRNGYEINISGIGPPSYGDVDYTSVRLSAVWDITANIENYTIGSYTHSDTDGSVQKLIGCNPAGLNPTSPAAIGQGIGNFAGILSCNQLASEAARGASFYDVEAAAASPESLIQTWQIINTTTWTANDNLKIKNIASYGQYRDNQLSPLFGTNWNSSTLPQPYPEIFFRGVPALFTGIFPIPGGDSADQSTYTEELQFQGNTPDQKLTYQAGAYLEWSDPLALIGNQSPQLVQCTNVASFNCIDGIGSAISAVESEALGFPVPVHVGAVNYTAGETWYRDRGLYAQSTYSLTDQLKLTGGLRETWDDQRATATRTSNSFAVLPPYTPGPTTVCTDPNESPSCYQSLEKRSDKPTWLVDLDYKLVDDVLLYAKYARGYRAGGVFSNAPVDHRTFDPEKVDSYEGGIKTTFAEPIHGLFNVAVFYNNFTNQQLQLGFNPATLADGFPAPVSPTTAIINAGKSRIYGAEVELSVTPIDGVTIDTNYTYLNATIQSINAYSTDDPNYQPATNAIKAGAPLALSPKNKVSVEADYRFPLPSTVGRVIFGTTFTHTDKQLSDYNYLDPAVVALFGQNLSFLPATNLLNLNLAWNSIMGSSVDVSAFVTNVTQDKYYSFIPGLGSAQLGMETAVLGLPRMYGARIRYTFGK